MHSEEDFIADINKDNRSAIYRCRWSEADSKKIVPKLIEILTCDNHLLVDESLRALFTIGIPAESAAQEVRKLLKSPHPITRRLSLQTLGQIAHKNRAREITGKQNLILIVSNGI